MALLASCWAAGASAQSLSELYQTARGYDAAFLAAQAQAEATGYKVEQAKAANLPNVGLKGSISRNQFEPANKNFQLGNVDKFHFTNKSLALQARQSLYNKGVTTSIQQSEESLKVAQAELRVAESDLIVRLSQAYFDVLGARDALTTAQTNKKALAEQLASAKRNFEVGNATITDTREAQARFDLATAQEIAAENDLKVKSIALDQLVGLSNVQPLPLAAPAQSPVLSPATADEWVALTADSPNVVKAQVALDIARIESGKAQGEHLPTADLVGTISRTEVDGSASAALASSTGTNASIGVEVNVPVFAGFATTNRIKESASLLTKSERDLDNARRSMALATRQAFFGVQSGQAQVKALEAAEASAKLALEATQLGYRVGVRVNKDVLDAQTALATTQRDLSKARYDVIVGTMKLRQLSGSLKAEDLDNLNKLLTR
ncbi:TolC family outer membrane protein [Aquabacterium lacunae]|uniref:TolC family outer membrane protein n=1 Tax=Aquabacterium lacunae TaxID=2528630 RepID=UPI001FE1594B|nr:TolC family outer membrane protein [Aquabacterium lacunae]